MTVSYRPQRIEADIDEMMNALFTEVDQILEQGSGFSAFTGKDKHNVSSQKTDILPAKSANEYHHDSGNGSEPFSSQLLRRNCSRSSSFSRFIEDEDYKYHNRRRQQINQVPLWVRHLDKIVFSSSCCLLLGILIFLQKQEQLAGVSVAQLSDQIAVSNVADSSLDTDAKFLSYMERALEEINQQQKLAQKQQEQQEHQTEPIQPQPIQPQPSQPAQPAQRNQPMVVSSLPALPPPPPSTPQSAPSVSQPQSNPSSSPSANNLTNTNTAAKRNSQKNAAKSPPESESTQMSRNNGVSQTENQAPQLPSYTLVGLLELGEHSAALLKTKETTQRVMLGETIPGSNWTLVSINNQKATFEKNSQQKSMSVGQKTSAD